MSPSFVYSVGLMFSLAHPELIVFGLGDEGYNVLRAMVEDIRSGRSFGAPAAYDGVLAQGSVATRPVHPSQHESYLGYAIGYCRERGRMGELQTIQVFWPDHAGRFPFERDCDEAVWAAQPRLDRPFARTCCANGGSTAVDNSPLEPARRGTDGNVGESPMTIGTALPG